ncbi:gluconokinase [Chitinophaga vietnamensis]|uniref:gluconokinase n=1 Tax=Chitinophaga vietnamensis TaxID=2593957 RepID=UPI0013761672|nr:gluconokinase [Chitinophaga vietnamensis]
MSERYRYIIGSDIGTGSAKTIGLGMNGQVLSSWKEAYPTAHPAPGFSEQDPDRILKAVMTGIRAVIQQVGHPPAAISFSSAMHSFMAIDAAGAPLTPLIIWADNRSQLLAEALRATPAGAAIYHSTGTPVHAMSPLSKAIWLQKEQPSVFAAAKLFIGIKEYIIHHLTGEYLVDHSIASATGLFDIHTLQWSVPALEAAGLQVQRLPQPVPADHIISRLKSAIAKELGIPPDTPLVMGGSDGCLAQLGSAAMDAGHATLTIGTSGAVRMAIPGAVTDPQARLFTYLLTDDVYIMGGATNNGGVVLQWLLRDFLQQPPENTDRLINEALALPPDGLLCLPYLLGERAPIWDSGATAAFIGIQPQHRAPHFTRAVLEGTCFALLNIKNALQETAGEVRKISVSGGFTHSPAWIQLLADIFGQPMTLQQQSDASALGAIILAASALKMPPIAGLASAKEKLFQPDMRLHEIYRPKFDRFRRLSYSGL